MSDTEVYAPNWQSGAAVNATDSAEELAAEHGIDVTTIDGTGVDGRVLKADVERAIEEG